MSSEPPALSEFFHDRSLGKTTAARLRSAGWVVHLVNDHYSADAQFSDDEEWIRHGCTRGWALLSKDKHIRYRGAQLAELTEGHLFCLSSGQLGIDEMERRFLAAESAI